jgi:hypothetical protein
LTAARCAVLQRSYSTAPALERDELWFDRHPALAFCLSMIFSENRIPLFRIMLQLAIDVAGGVALLSIRVKLSHRHVSGWN